MLKSEIKITSVIKHSTEPDVFYINNNAALS